MDSGSWVAVVSIVCVVLIAVVGGIIRALFTQLSEQKRLNETQRATFDARLDTLRSGYEAKLEIAERALEAKSETVDELRRQNDRLMITAEIAEKFFKQLPPAPPPMSGTR